MLGFSHIAGALSQVTRGGSKVKFLWGNSQQKAFNDLKKRMCSTPILSLPDLHHPFEIETDSSYYAMGVVLTQILSDTVCKYPTYDKEMYSIV